MFNIINKILTSRKATVQVANTRSQDCVDGITTYYANGVYSVIGRLGGRVYKARHLSYWRARDHAREWLYLYLNGELY